MGNSIISEACSSCYFCKKEKKKGINSYEQNDEKSFKRNIIMVDRNTNEKNESLKKEDKNDNISQIKIEDFKVLKIIGKGAFAKVVLAEKINESI